MIRMKKYLEFTELTPKPKTKVFAITNKAGDYFGTIEWKSTWRKYCFLTVEYETWFDSNCLKEIVNKLDELNKEHKGGNRG
jgi:hypothetical protein